MAFGRWPVVMGSLEPGRFSSGALYGPVRLGPAQFVDLVRVGALLSPSSITSPLLCSLVVATPEAAFVVVLAFLGPNGSGLTPFVDLVYLAAVTADPGTPGSGCMDICPPPLASGRAPAGLLQTLPSFALVGVSGPYVAGF
jgi:hypothetical protein